MIQRLYGVEANIGNKRAVGMYSSFQKIVVAKYARLQVTTIKAISPFRTYTSDRKFRIVAATIIERVPIVLPEIPQFEKNYMEFCAKRNTILDKEQEEAAKKRVEEELKIRAKKERASKKKDAAGKTLRNTGEGNEGGDLTEELKKEKKIYPLITPADLSNDMKSVYRKLTNRLYLIVKKPRKEFSWQFPQGGYEEKDGKHLRVTAQRELQEECGTKLHVWWIGNSPMGNVSYPLPVKIEDKYNATKVFFL